jgi:hypothetical protein
VQKNFAVARTLKPHAVREEPPLEILEVVDLAIIAKNVTLVFQGLITALVDTNDGQTSLRDIQAGIRPEADCVRAAFPQGPQ